MIHNVLARQLPIRRERVDAALEAVGIARERRPQTVGGRRVVALAEALGPIPAADDERPSRPDRRLAPVVRLAPAKVNLTLAVLGTRPDGFHDLHSVMARSTSRTGCRSPSCRRAAGTASTSTASTRAGRGQPRDPRDRGRPPPRRASASGLPKAPPPLAARLEKRIPSLPGLAGGSSDAAAAAEAALEAWGVDPGRRAPHAPRRRARLGRAVLPRRRAGARRGPGGAPDPAPLAAGRGTTRHDRPGLLLVTPACGILTPAAFPAWDEGARVAGGAARIASAHLAEELRRGSGSPTCSPAPPSWPPRTTWRPPLRSLSPASCRSSGRSCGSWAVPSASRVGPHPLGPLSFPCRGGGGGGCRPGGRSRRRLPPPDRGRPFVAATRILARTDDPRRQP